MAKLGRSQQRLYCSCDPPGDHRTSVRDAIGLLPKITKAPLGPHCSNSAEGARKGQHHSTRRFDEAKVRRIPREMAPQAGFEPATLRLTATHGASSSPSLATETC